jgi:hypothetical protein
MNSVLSPVVSPVLTLGEVVDRLGHLRAELADLEVLEKQFKQTLTDSGETKVVGQLYKAAVIYSAGRITTDWKSIAEHFTPSRQLVTAYTSQGASFTSVRISSR